MSWAKIRPWPGDNVEIPSRFREAGEISLRREVWISRSRLYLTEWALCLYRFAREDRASSLDLKISIFSVFLSQAAPVRLYAPQITPPYQ
jgi:hypothetical protein